MDFMIRRRTGSNCLVFDKKIEPQVSFQYKSILHWLMSQIIGKHKMLERFASGMEKSTQEWRYLSRATLITLFRSYLYCMRIYRIIYLLTWFLTFSSLSAPWACFMHLDHNMLPSSVRITIFFSLILNFTNTINQSHLCRRCEMSITWSTRLWSPSSIHFRKIQLFQISRDWKQLKWPRNVGKLTLYISLAISCANRASSGWTELPIQT